MESNPLHQKFGQLRSMLNLPYLNRDTRAVLWELLYSAYEMHPEAYTETWLPYLTGFKHHFAYTLDSCSLESLETYTEILPFGRFRLWLAHYDGYSDPDFIEELKRCEHGECITEIQFSWPYNKKELFDDTFIEAFAKLTNFPNLLSLNLCECKWTGEGVQALTSSPHFPRLKLLNLVGYYVSDETLTSEDFDTLEKASHMPELRYLHGTRQSPKNLGFVLPMDGNIDSEMAGATLLYGWSITLEELLLGMDTSPVAKIFSKHLRALHEYEDEEDYWDIDLNLRFPGFSASTNLTHSFVLGCETGSTERTSVVSLEKHGEANHLKRLQSELSEQDFQTLQDHQPAAFHLLLENVGRVATLLRGFEMKRDDIYETDEETYEDWLREPLCHEDGRSLFDAMIPETTGDARVDALLHILRAPGATDGEGERDWEIFSTWLRGQGREEDAHRMDALIRLIPKDALRGPYDVELHCRYETATDGPYQEYNTGVFGYVHDTIGMHATRSRANDEVIRIEERTEALEERIRLELQAYGLTEEPRDYLVYCYY